VSVNVIYSKENLHQKAQALFKEERNRKRLDGWFIAKEIARDCDWKFKELPPELKAAETLSEILKQLPVTISEHSIFAGTQNDAFARSYALINPLFKVDSFTGYCDPTAVFNDIEPNEIFTGERIEELRSYTKETPFVKALEQAYENSGDYTSEAIFFIEQVTGHLVPDFKYVLAEGIEGLINKINVNLRNTTDAAKRINLEAMKVALEAAILLASRYMELAKNLQEKAGEKRKQELILMESTLKRVPAKGARNLYEAIQSYILLWQVICIEQAPNPFAFSVGNADRIFEPYRAMENLGRDMSAALLKHFLVYFNVGDRSWAISQNIIVGGRSNGGADITNETTFAILDAYYEMNLPQPILSVKLHKQTPGALYENLGRFFFTPGCLTPSLFNDDSLFEVLLNAGMEKDDLEDYSIAGCQEPLIMGKDNGNTTNSWLNLAKILELTINDGVSTITGRKIGLGYNQLEVDGFDAQTVFTNVREAFYKHVNYFIDKMTVSANQASEAISLLPVPFLTTFMGGVDSGFDLRDTQHQSTKYNGSGCLIHGLSVVADSFIAIDMLLSERPQDCQRLIAALRTNFIHDEELRRYLNMCPKYGNNLERVDKEAHDIIVRISDLVASRKNYLGNPFRPDWSSPSTHLLYGYWVGATPDGRKGREMLGYGIDPLYGEANSGLGFRVLSNMKLPYEKMNGGYASHFGINPTLFKSKSFEEKGIEFRNKVILPLFFNEKNKKLAPFYLYVNVTTPETLRKVLANPAKYAPSGVYIMRIHGTFVNFLDLSPEIQEDIIKRLDLKSTTT
jgi:choline trimethylamine-lyase